MTTPDPDADRALIVDAMLHAESREGCSHYWRDIADAVLSALRARGRLVDNEAQRELFACARRLAERAKEIGHPAPATGAPCHACGHQTETRKLTDAANAPAPAAAPSVALLACPFCGSEAREERPHHHVSLVYCSNLECPVHPNTGWCDESEESATSRWNRRAALVMEEGDWGRKAGDHHEGLPTKYWTRPGDVVLQFKNQAGIDALISELQVVREKIPPAPAQAGEGVTDGH